MHYGRTAFNKGGRNTIEAKYDQNMDLGNQQLSPIDIEEIKKKYHCDSKYVL